MFGLPVGIAGGDFGHGLYLRSPVTVLDLACRSLRPEERDE